MLAAALALCATAAIPSPAVAQDPPPIPLPVGPTVSQLTIYGIDGADPGYVKQFGGIYMYAYVQDPGGVETVTADISSIGMPSGHTMFQNTNLPMEWDMFSDWWYFDWRARQTVAEGTYPWSVTATNSLGFQTTESSTVIMDNTKPSATDVQTANKPGGIAGKAEEGDTLTYTFSEVMGKWLSQEGGFNHTVRIDNSGTNDILRIYNAGNVNESIYFGSVKLGKDYVSANRTFGATGTKSRLVRNGNQTIVTLGTPSGTTNTVTSGAKMTWTPTGAFDRAGNKTLTTTANESGTLDREF